MRRGIGSDSPDDDDEIEIECKIIHKTEEGTKIRTANKQAWLPSRYVTEIEGGVRIPEWLAYARELI